MFDFLTNTSYSFEDKRPYENVILFLHRHWFVLFLQFIVFFLVGLLPIVAYYGIHRFLTISSEWDSLIALIVSAFYLFWWYGLFYRITMYLLDYWIVTDHRVVDSEQHGFFNRTTAELTLAKIQDISVQIVGVIPTWLDYGNLEIQTAGATEKFFFKEIPHPQIVKDKIMEAHNAYIKDHPGNLEVHEGLTTSP